MTTSQRLAEPVPPLDNPAGVAAKSMPSTASPTTLTNPSSTPVHSPIPHYYASNSTPSTSYGLQMPYVTPMDPTVSTPSFSPPAQRPPFPAPVPVNEEEARAQQLHAADQDDSYPLKFGSLEEFRAWCTQEEEAHTVEFIKLETHGSKNIPPRFKDHTKLVCTRHERTSKKKNPKKLPDRQRKLPNRKHEGEGCPAYICYKTFYGTPTVRALYMKQHSHELGAANFPYTRKGRKAAEELRKKHETEHSNTKEGGESSNSVLQVPLSSMSPPSESSESNESFSSPVMGSLAPPRDDELAMIKQQYVRTHQPTTEDTLHRGSESVAIVVSPIDHSSPVITDPYRNYSSADQNGQVFSPHTQFGYINAPGNSSPLTPNSTSTGQHDFSSPNTYYRSHPQQNFPQPHSPSYVESRTTSSPQFSPAVYIDSPTLSHTSSESHYSYPHTNTLSHSSPITPFASTVRPTTVRSHSHQQPLNNDVRRHYQAVSQDALYSQAQSLYDYQITGNQYAQPHPQSRSGSYPQQGFLEQHHLQSNAETDPQWDRLDSLYSFISTRGRSRQLSERETKALEMTLSQLCESVTSSPHSAPTTLSVTPNIPSTPVPAVPMSTGDGGLADAGVHTQGMLGGAGSNVKANVTQQNALPSHVQAPSVLTPTDRQYSQYVQGNIMGPMANTDVQNLQQMHMGSHMHGHLASMAPMGGMDMNVYGGIHDMTGATYHSGN